MSGEQQRGHRLHWEACFNARDLGGYETPDGRFTRWRSLVRTDNLRRLTSAGRAALVDYGVRTVIDLRAPFELQIDPCPFAPGTPFPRTPASLTSPASPDCPAYLHLPLLGDPGPAESDRRLTAAIDAAPTVEAMYAVLLERRHAAIAAVLRAIAVAPQGGVLIYCHAGKDRTGLVAALVLAIAGVPHAAIAEDYGLSDRNLQPLYTAQLQHEPDTARRAHLAQRLHSPLNAARPHTMLATLAHLEQRHGSVADYLRWAGLAQGDLDRLRARMAG